MVNFGLGNENKEATEWLQRKMKETGKPANELTSSPEFIDIIKRTSKLNESEFSDDLEAIFSDALNESANLVIKLSKFEYKNLFNIPFSKLMSYNISSIKKEIFDKGNGKSIKDYILPSMYSGLTINTIKAYVMANGSLDDKNFLKERMDRLQKAIDKALDKDLDSMDFSYSQINGVLALYKRTKKKK